MFPKFNQWLICAVSTSTLACTYYDPNSMTLVKGDPCITQLWNGFGLKILSRATYVYWPSVGAKIKLIEDATPEEIESAQILPVLCEDLGPLTKIAGEYFPSDGTIVLNTEEFSKYDPISQETLDDPNFLVLMSELVAHEIGHSFQMSHLSNPEAVMYPEMNGAVKLSSPDLGQWCDVHGCP